MGNNNSKGLLIPHNTILMLVGVIKAGDFFGNLALEEGFTAYQLVCRVIAYQGDDG